MKLIPLFAGLRPVSFGADVLAGLTLAAITLPEQMATARLGGFDPAFGFYAFIAATLAFALAGRSAVLTVGADSTITPIFAGSIAAMAAASGQPLASLAVVLALMIGAILIVAGLLRLGWIAHLLSIPVITGFLAGISVHIVLGQLPVLMGVAKGEGMALSQILALAAAIPKTNLWSLALGLGVLAIIEIVERIDRRLPAALLAVVLAVGASYLLNLQAHGVKVIGPLSSVWAIPAFPDSDVIAGLVPLALILSLIIMMQTALVSRSFVAAGTQEDINRDFVGVGLANLASGFSGAFPVNASPPRTAAYAGAGGTGQAGILVAALLMALLLAFGSPLLAEVPQAALAGVLLYVARRIFRLDSIREIAGASRPEFLLILCTMLAVALLPIQTGVAIGVGLSLAHSVWMTSATKPLILSRLKGTTIWWPDSRPEESEQVPGVLALAFQAPLSFANASLFKTGILDLLESEKPQVLVLDGSDIADIDFTGGKALADVVTSSRAMGIHFALARLESRRASLALERLGLRRIIGDRDIFHSVEQAVEALVSRPASGDINAKPS